MVKSDTESEPSLEVLSLHLITVIALKRGYLDLL